MGIIAYDYTHCSSKEETPVRGAAGRHLRSQDLCFENSPQVLAAARQEQIDVAFWILTC